MISALQRPLYFLSRFGLYIGCAYISLFILASGYESVYNRALPFVHSLAPVTIDTLSRTYNLQAAYAMKPSSLGKFGKPVVLTIPGRSGTKRLSIVAPIKQDDTWLARAATMHLLVTTPPISGNISTAVLYCRASFRTISGGALPASGSNLFIDTDEQWRYVYKVSLAKTYAKTYAYTPAGEATESSISQASKGKLIIFCDDSKNKANTVVEADLISVQGTTQ